MHLGEKYSFSLAEHSKRGQKRVFAGSIKYIQWCIQQLPCDVDTPVSRGQSPNTVAACLEALMVLADISGHYQAKGLAHSSVLLFFFSFFSFIDKVVFVVSLVLSLWLLGDFSARQLLVHSASSRNAGDGAQVVWGSHLTKTVDC